MSDGRAPIPEPLASESPAEWARAACDSLMRTYRPEELPPAGRWHYHQGVFLVGMLRLWEMSGDPAYLDYAKSYVDHLVDERGNLVCEKGELDAIQPGLLLLALHEHTGENRYRVAASKLRHLFETFNRTSEDGFWHKDKYPYQMWLDGLYMGGVFAVRYGKLYGEPALFDLAAHQERLLREHAWGQEPLPRHAWDESRRAEWADPQTGRSPECWGRAIGWYGLALTDMLDDLPESHPARAEMAKALGRLVAALVPFQDAVSGLWHQVVDKGHLPDNWLETSCSCLFAYAIAKAVRLRYVDGRYADAAFRCFRGLIRRMRYGEDGRLIVPDICIGTGVGDYAHYVNRPRRDNDLHGVGAFVLACVELARLLDERRGGTAKSGPCHA